MNHTAAYDRFMASMKIGFMEWHDGIPYDLSALAGVSPEELAELEALLVERKNEDWRDIDALARIGTPSAWRAIRESTTGPDREVRIRAAKRLYEARRLDSLDEVIIEGLRFGEIGEGLAQAERLAAASCRERRASRSIGPGESIFRASQRAIPQNGGRRSMHCANSSASTAPT